MDSTTSFPSLTISRWLGLAILILALLQIILAIISMVFSFIWPLDTYISIDELISNTVTGIIVILLLLGYVILGYRFLKPSARSRSRSIQVSSFSGLALGIVLGIIMMLPGQTENSCPGFALILLIAIVPWYFINWLRGEYIPFSQMAPFALFMLSILVYGAIAWWTTRRTGSLGTGVRSALLSAFLASLTTSVVATLIRYAPLLWSPHQVTPVCYYADGVAPPHFKYYYSFLIMTMYPLVSQLVFAVIAGLLGGLLHRRRAKTSIA